MTAMIPSTRPSRQCSPKYATRRRPERPSYGGEQAKIAVALRQPYMPWQRMVSEVAGEYDPETGIPFYREVIVTVPRQSGKTTLFLSMQCHRCTAPRWSHPQRSVFTAQTGKDARDKWLDELFPLLRKSMLNPLVQRIYEGMGNEYVKFRNGSLIRILSSSKSSGHSKTLHQAVADEVWSDVDNSREQGLRPAMATISDAQLLVCSTAGNEHSVVLQHKVKAGRAAVAADTGRGIAYFEYSAPGGKDWDPFDDESYYGFHPALCPDPPCRCGNGEWRHTQTLDTLLVERAGMTDINEFKRAYGNIESASQDREIPEAVWRRVQSDSAFPSGELRYGLDIAEDRSSGAITAFGGGVIEPIDHRAGVGWMVKRASDIALKHDGVVVLDGGGPAAYMAKDLRAAGVRVEAMSAAQVIEQCSRIYDDIADSKMKFSTRGDYWPAMDDAVAGLVSKPAGDRTVWSRVLSTSDITPFYAATLAYQPLTNQGAFMMR